MLASEHPVYTLKEVPKCLKVFLRHCGGHRRRPKETGWDIGIEIPFQTVVFPCGAVEWPKMNNLVFERTIRNATASRATGCGFAATDRLACGKSKLSIPGCKSWVRKWDQPFPPKPVIGSNNGDVPQV